MSRLSRGCPFKCEFCLSALDKTAWPFDLEPFMAELEKLYVRGARNFRFVDRTFNLKVAASQRILEFFLARMDDNLFMHFELIPDHLPDKLKQTITRFPPGALHFEIGIQTFNPEVQARISRRQDDAQAEANIRWLREQSNALIHVDLIAGLPGEDLASFGRGFDRLHALEAARDPGRHPEALAWRADRPAHRNASTALQPGPAVQRVGDRLHSVCRYAAGVALCAVLGI
jgi:radical SAM superfamily enzyme YgiQ (UPF0313 family)